MSSVKVAVMGRGSVGKSCLSIRFVQNTFVPEYEPTISNTYKKTLTVDGKTYSIDILDTAGMENIDAMKTSLIRQRDCFVLVYSIVDRESFDSINQYHEDILRIKDSPQVPCILCGNKKDLDSKREVSEQEGQDLARSIKAVFLETSAANGYNVNSAMEEAVREVVKAWPKTSGKEDGKPHKIKCNLL